MLRDFKFLRRNSAGKNSNSEEIENVPLNPSNSLATQTSTDSTRAPLNAIQEPIQNHKTVAKQELGVRSGKIDRTPTKSKGKVSDNALIRTPEKPGFSAKNRFGFSAKNESGWAATESRDDDRSDVKGSGIGGFANLATPRSTRTLGRAVTSHSECNSTQSTPTKSVSKPPNPGFFLASGSRPPVNGGVRIGNYAALSKGLPISCSSIPIVNSVEVPHFDLKEDPAFWMEHNVQVLIRIRPLNSMEKSTHGYNRCLKQESAQCITWIGQPETRFTFDHIACETVDQGTLFRMVGLPMVENCLSGYNSCIFAYGQTGSGKTYTMLGEIKELEVKPSANRGMTPRIFEFLFARIRAEEESRRDERLKYSCKCSFLEIYNEQISDLLDPSSTNLLLREDTKKGVYVENLSEFEVQTVGDILKLLHEGSLNRKVAATNMNRESSRSHSVFTCIIESRWEKDATSNLRFARLNLVDLAGSERQKSSGAEGERLKEAANINKSLSTLGHVIMVLIDLAHGKPKHVPYRDSRLTFLLQDSLGGNSKTMIIANVSPSIWCAAETLNTLKFAQRAKLIPNNAIVNEDSSGDVIALQHQIRLLKEELAVLRRQNVSRSLSFGPTTMGDVTKQEPESSCDQRTFEMDQQQSDLTGSEPPKGILRLSSKQLKSLETTLAGALRREQMAESSIKQLEAEIEQLNRLVRQREEDTRCTKMMLKFREDKIQRMESLVGGLLSADTYLLEENSALSEEIQLLQAKIDKNPEVTRFALENIRLLEQVRRYQDFYEEGEREMLITEVSELRNQLVHFLDGNPKPYNHPKMDLAHQEEALHIRKENDSLHLELNKTLNELEECRNNLNSCLEKNAQLSREIEDLNASLNNLKYETHDHDCSIEIIKESIVEAPSSGDQSYGTVQESRQMKHEPLIHSEVMDLQLEVDILKIILKEERLSCAEIQEREQCLNRDLELTSDKLLLITKQYEDVNEELKEAKSVIEALESQQILSINEMEDLRNSNNNYADRLSRQELEISTLKEQIFCQELRDHPSSENSETADSPLKTKLKKMQHSLEKAKKLNMWYQSDRSLQVINEEEMDEVRRQVEAETAEVIVCLQDELAILQQQIQESNLKETESEQKLVLIQTEMKELQEKVHLLTHDNKKLCQDLEERGNELRTLSEEWELLTGEIEVVLADGHEALKDASDQLQFISGSLTQKRSLIFDQVGRIRKIISEKELLIQELNHCLEDADNRRSDLESMIRSLRGATLIITEAHQQECSEREKEILLLTSQSDSKSSTIAELENRIRKAEEQIQKASTSATVAFVVVNRLSEVNSTHLDVIKQKDASLQNQAAEINEAHRKIQSLSRELDVSEENCGKLRMQLSIEREHACAMEQKLEEIQENDILKASEKLSELRSGVSTLKLSMNEYSDQVQGSNKVNAPRACVPMSDDVRSEARTGSELNQHEDNIDRSYTVDYVKTENPVCSFKTSKNLLGYLCDQQNFSSQRVHTDLSNRDATIILLKNEIESALDSLKGVHAEMARLRSEKEEVRTSEKQNQESTRCVLSQVLSLQEAMSNFEKQCGLKMASLDQKLQTVEEIVQEVDCCWHQEKVLLESELGDAKVVAAQKTAEASCILAKFEEAQDTMKEADIMINELLITNETLKLKIEELKKMEVTLINKQDVLVEEVQRLQSTNSLSKLNFENLEKQFSSDLSEMERIVLDLEGIVAEVQTTTMEDFMSTVGDFMFMNSQLQDSMKLMHSWNEVIWSEIIVKDCAVSVLHLCHIGLLLETVTGLNAENGLLHNGLSDSNSVISELREYNLRSTRELEMCRVLKGKLLSDIKSGFDRISSKEKETGELQDKLASFERKILDLQLQEELMLQRSNHFGSELVILIKELNLSNRDMLASLLGQEKLLKDREEVFKTQEDNFMMDVSAKNFELLILSSKFEEMALQSANAEKEKVNFSTVIENFKKEIIFLMLDAELKERILLDNEAKIGRLEKEIEVSKRERQDILSDLSERNFTIAEMGKSIEAFEQDIQFLKDTALSNDSLKGELNEATQEKIRLLSEVQKLESSCGKILEDIKAKETALEISSNHISALDQQNKLLQDNIFLLETSSQKLKNELKMKDEEVTKMNCLAEENTSLEDELRTLKKEYCSVLQGLEEKKSELASCLCQINSLDKENHRMLEKISFLETKITNLQTASSLANAELNELKLSQSVVKGDLCSKSQDLQIYINKVNALKEENISLKNELQFQQKERFKFLTTSSFTMVQSFEAVENVNMVGSRIFDVLNEGSDALERMFLDICKKLEITSKFVEEAECLENLAGELMTENFSLQTELSRKDEVLNGMLFDLRLLQESASNTKDQRDEIEELVVSLEASEGELALRTSELDKAIANVQMLEAQLQEKIGIIFSLQLDISKLNESVKTISTKNLELTANIKDAVESKRSIEEELSERRKVNQTLEMELLEVGISLGEMNNSIESLKSDLDAITSERNDLHTEVQFLKKKAEMAEALADEKDAVFMEAQQIAESTKLYAEEKEEEVKLLERSVEELECTVNVLENKVDIIKGEAERQRLQREELELELHSVKQQMLNVESSDTDMKRHLDEKENNLQEAVQRIQILEKEIATKDAEIAKCKAHIEELNLHAEAQASEYKQKFKALEAMAEQVKPEGPYAPAVANASGTKLEKNGSKSRGSGSPFKCIGLGLVQQIKSERDEELTAGRLRIEELEALAASRQKEIFMLNARLAAAESMTHDVIRDLLGLKLDMTNYASLLDNHQVQKITEKAQVYNGQAQVKDQEVIKLKQQLNEFIEERKGWLEEIDRKQAEMIAAQIALEKFRQRDRLLTTEKEMLKMENASHRKKIMELETELKKLSGQQNLHQRIHHHAKIKEENNLLKSQNDELSVKLRRTEAILTRVKEELAHFRSTNGRTPYINFDEEERLKNILKENEEERLQLAQKLVGLCTSILKAAGVTRAASDTGVSVAEEALEQLKNRVSSLERELQDARFKNRLTDERIRLSELKPQASSMSSRTDEHRRPSDRVSQAPFLSTLDR
ncbi:kinesin-like protein KIN-12D [Diospyros lotus]|uniref:kinesin-like protein KIN-12D n=1 Tax=Diospyros lotus TaxID=55363 RepID=UPI002252313C|nr:kinesin-like protein KIN-12D [Diospyros lotus]